MQSVAQVGAVSKARFWTGWILTGLLALLLLLDGAMKLVKPAFVVEANLKLGYPENTILPIGVVLIACTILYLIP
ncbi:MAG TPA: DoxX family protein, partial [Pyrinomonadaceae bacterium]|nr:DoxX family protein [Pyrinomonadaceae bacterium]